jgi:hypothetical protein
MLPNVAMTIKAKHIVFNQIFQVPEIVGNFIDNYHDPINLKSLQMVKVKSM